MTEILSTVIDPERARLFKPGTVDGLIDALERYTLDPICERHGGFVRTDPVFPKSPENTAKYRGCVAFMGSFLDLPQSFQIFSNDYDVVGRITTAILRNVHTPEYQKARAEYVSKGELV